MAEFKRHISRVYSPDKSDKGTLLLHGLGQQTRKVNDVTYGELDFISRETYFFRGKWWMRRLW